MRELFERYIANLEEATQLVKLRITEHTADQEILDQVQGAAVKLRQLCVEDNQLLDQLLFSKKAEELSPQEVQDLAWAAGKLCSHAKSLDVGGAYYIHKLLYQYAQLHQDRDMIIRELYSLGMTCFYLNLKISPMDINVFKKEIDGYFRQGAAYFAQWDEIESQEIRGFIIRCMANRNLTVPRDLDQNGCSAGISAEELYRDYLKNFRETMDVVESPSYRAQNPDIPWDSFRYSLHYDRSSFLGYLRAKPLPQIQQDVMESAEYVYRYQEQAAQAKSASIMSDRTIYTYAAARYHSGRMSITDFMDVLCEGYHRRNPLDFSNTGIQLNIMYPLYLEYYSHCLSPEDLPRYQEEIDQLSTNIYRYLLDMPRNEYINKVASTLRDVMHNFPSREDFANAHLLETILTCHAPTYVHSVMVAWLNRQIMKELLHKDPQSLVGLFGHESVESLLAHRKELCVQAYTCGLYHDLGKSMVVNYIGIYGRRLLDEEFTCIKYHSQLGRSILEDFPGYDDLSMVALHHHRSYDGRGGYPRDVEPCPLRVREMAYITSISDSIDAATDNVGRSYHSAKTFDTLVEELFQRSGSSYAPEIVRLFEDEHFRSRLGRELDEFRKLVYCKVYRELAERP